MQTLVRFIILFSSIIPIRHFNFLAFLVHTYKC